MQILHRLIQASRDYVLFPLLRVNPAVLSPQAFHTFKLAKRLGDKEPILNRELSKLLLDYFPILFAEIAWKSGVSVVGLCRVTHFGLGIVTKGLAGDREHARRLVTHLFRLNSERVTLILKFVSISAGYE